MVGHDSSLRVECRIPGADCNPYRVYSAALAAGLDGIANQGEPPAHFDGDVYQAEDLPTVPANLSEATDELEGSAVLRAAFGVKRCCASGVKGSSRNL